MPRLAIIGLGLIGGSLGLALKAANLESLEIVGHDREWGVGGRAKRLGAIDQDARLPEDAVEGASIVVIATPVSQVKQTMKDIASSLSEGAVVTDTASTKRDVMRWAKEHLPDNVNFVGGHPIAGKETSGLDAAEATLFQGRPWAVIPSVRASEAAVTAVENLVRLAGAVPVIIDAEEHDSYLAAVSHLPLLAATALFSLAAESPAWPDLAALAGPGFRDTTRLGSTNPDLGHDISLTNRENILHWLDRYIDELRRYRALVAQGGALDELYKQLAKVQTARDSFLEKPPERPRSAEEVASVSAGQAMLQFMVGEWAVRRAKQVEDIAERRVATNEPPRKDVS
jgi:prephenate dehydrogenase